jgi:Transposase DDE domain group 1
VPPQCTDRDFLFEALPRRQVVARFDGGTITSDGGVLLLAAVERRTSILRRLAACFTDHRDPDLVEHTALQLVSQRVYGLCLGYEDLNDHDSLRTDPLLATLVGKADPSGHDRVRARDKGKPLAGKSTLNRLELTPADATPAQRYKKIVADPAAIDRLLVDAFLEAYPTPPAQIVLDLDSTDDPLHGHQEGRFFHGYYGGYCYLPLYIFCGEHVLAARLRTADHGDAQGVLEELPRVIAQIRAAWPGVRIVVRGDSGFCREEIMAWCEANDVDYLFGLARNSRLEAMIERAMMDAHIRHLATGVAARVFVELRYRTLDSWSRERRVVAKAEYLAKGPNPRFVVTSLAEERRAGRPLYEEDYCARGDMENRIKEQQLWLFADRMSTEFMRSNQLRLYFSSVAYVLLSALRRLGLAGTELARAQCGTMRLCLLKIGALVRVTVRRVWVSLASSCPWQEVFTRAYANLRGGAMPAGAPDG